MEVLICWLLVHTHPSDEAFPRIWGLSFHRQWLQCSPESFHHNCSKNCHYNVTTPTPQCHPPTPQHPLPRPLHGVTLPTATDMLYLTVDTSCHTIFSIVRKSVEKFVLRRYPHDFLSMVVPLSYLWVCSTAAGGGAHS